MFLSFVLVGGTSGLLANALNKAATEYGANIKAAAGSYGAHMDIMKDYDFSHPSTSSGFELRRY